MKTRRIEINNVFTYLLVASISLLLLPAIEAIFIIPFLWLPIPVYLVKIICIIFLIYRFLPSLINTYRHTPILTFFITLLYLSVAISLYYPPSHGKDGFVNFKNIPHEYSDQHWYFLNRINPIFPFDQTGMAYISSNDGLSLPPGFATRTRVTNGGWYGIRTYRFLIMAVVYSILMTILAISFCTYILSKMLKPWSHKSKNGF